ncbi:MAG: HEPN domain-containing protein [Cyclobacteriaceae bacterium]|nr:HEPN domain-containing protein [Cyclobacteriaceae bacterium]
MLSFRNELEDLNNPIVERDIIDLEKKIRLFQDGKIDPDKFRSMRLARGIYGQRQPGVQMIRIKLPSGRLSTRQLRRIADISDEYASSNLHATTRQDIQIHFVSLDKTPELWAKLEKDEITLREACGNTVRNITASATAGIDLKELFDLTPYAHEMFRYFLRNPICQEMGRKFKIAFSSSDDDSAFTFIHDLGFIPRIHNGQRGFKVVIGGGLGANPYLAQTAYEFLAADQLIPFTEGVIRVFDRYGERNRRMKARLKFLLDDIGLPKLMELVDEEKKALKYKSYAIDGDFIPDPVLPDYVPEHVPSGIDQLKYDRWELTNVITQKQEGYFGVYVKLPLGNLSSDLARKLADVVDRYAANELRVTVNQGYLIRFVRPESLKHLFVALDKLGLAEPGFDSVADITACPGTESCNLAISDSTSISLALEKVIREEYPEFIHNSDIKIKISGCPNSCGQHGLAGIGFHGSTIKDKSGKVAPALVVLLGGGKTGSGNGIIADKLIKIPSRRGPDALRLLLDDYETNSLEGEYYHDYFIRLGRNHFYTLLKPLADVTTLTPLEYIDWGQDENFVLHTAVGECAGVMIDLISTLLYETEEKLAWSKEAFDRESFADSIYHSYSAFINTAKALLLANDIKPSTQIQTLNDFQQHFIETGLIVGIENFKEYVLRINKYDPSAEFALTYWNDSIRFLDSAQVYRNTEKEVIEK